MFARENVRADPKRGWPVLLLHGWTLSLDTNFFGLLPDLARRYPFAGFDQRGHGRTLLDTGDFTIPDLAADAVVVLDELGIEKAIVCGFSLGGPVGLHLAVALRRRNFGRRPLFRSQPARSGIRIPVAMAPVRTHPSPVVPAPGHRTRGSRLRPTRQTRTTRRNPRHSGHHRSRRGLPTPPATPTRRPTRREIHKGPLRPRLPGRPARHIR
ncbi:alpha/beta fold hydrolase [Amycolatopsis sp. H6(2020)]|nr:alpha/beta fold hydrolase [Amycolatopsis sp. H6(2020)]